MNIGDISGAKIKVVCDRLSALHRSFWADEDDISCIHVHFDLLIGIFSLKRIMDVEWSYRHIPGHQDDMPLANLDRWATLNIKCDYRAKLFMTKIFKGYKRRTPYIREGMWQLRIHRILVSAKTFKLHQKDYPRR